MPIILLTELAAMARSGASLDEYSPLSPNNCLLFRSDGKSLKAADANEVALMLRQLPCPVIGILSGRADSVIRKACDIVLEKPEQAMPLLANIYQSPIASAVLVQLLRATESLPVADALSMESMAYATLQSGPEYKQWLATSKPSPQTITDSGPPVILTRDKNRLSIELNRASNRNAMSVEVRDALVEALQLVLADTSIRAVEISGRGKCFSIGGDLSEFGTVPDFATGHVVRSLILPGRLLAQCAKRVTVRVHGACIGAGIELPAFASRIVASKDTFFHLPEVHFGLIPGAGGCVSISRRIGRQRLGWLALSGKRINAKLALAWGLIDALEKN